jgi:hypothetical protein
MDKTEELYISVRSYNVEGVPNTRKKNHVHHRPQLGGQTTCAHQKLQLIRIEVQ